MSAYEDTVLAARFAALAPEPLAGNWDEVLDRAGVARKGHRWPERSRVLQGRRGRLFVVLAAVALVGVVTATAFAVRAFVIDHGLVGLPPVGATPSTPESGVLEMYYWLHGVPGGGKSWVYADGRLIRAGGGSFGGFREQRLTREGVELLRSEIVSAGGFGHAQPPPGSDSLPNGWPPIQVRKGDRLVPLTWASDLKRLETRLRNPGLWLPASAWKQQKVRGYVPSRFEVCAVAFAKLPAGTKFQQMSPARIVSLLPAAAQDIFRDRDWHGNFGGSCFAVTTSEARSLAQVLDDAEPAKRANGVGLNYTFNAPDPSRQVWIHFEPYLPHGETTCTRCG